MAFLRVDASPLLPRLRSELVTLLSGLTDTDWTLPTACPGWPVHGVASHLLGVELGNVSLRRDHWGLGPAAGENFGDWLNAFNQQWVESARRLSPLVLIELLDLAARRFEEYAATLDLDALGGPVDWATGRDPAPLSRSPPRERAAAAGTSSARARAGNSAQADRHARPPARWPPPWTGRSNATPATPPRRRCAGGATPTWPRPSARSRRSSAEAGPTRSPPAAQPTG